MEYTDGASIEQLFGSSACDTVVDDLVSIDHVYTFVV